jgi:hypothetical protein
MQVTELQVQRSLAALTIEAVPGAPGGDDPCPAAPMENHAADVPVGLLERLTEASPIRSDRLEGARRRLEHGDQPSAEALAQRMVGRLVCDRLR